MPDKLNYRSCRRKNYVCAAYVEAAIHINKVFGSDRAYWMLIREKVPAPVIDRILRGKEGQLRRKDRRYSTVNPTIDAVEGPSQHRNRRTDILTSQRVDVAMVFQSMLGTDAAAQYLRGAAVPVWISARVLGSTKRRPSPELIVEGTHPQNG
ncbi:MAG TPA: hypothetical protein VF774_21960, partial [Pseudoduganella sp.]